MPEMSTREIAQMTRWDVTDQALEQYPNDADKAVDWIMAFLNDHPDLKDALVEPLLRRAFHECVEIRFNRDRQRYRGTTPLFPPPIPMGLQPITTNGSGASRPPTLKDPISAQRMADAHQTLKAKAVADWLHFKVTKGKYLQDCTRPELRTIGSRYVKTGLTDIPRGLLLLRVADELPEDETKVLKIMRRKKYTNKDIARWFDEIQRDIAGSLQRYMPETD